MQGGRLDPTFASGGASRFAFGSSSTASSGAAVLVQPDGHLIVAGTLLGLPPLGALAVSSQTLVVARMTEKGTLDAGFGSRGLAQLSLSVGVDAALQREGKIVVAGVLRGNPGLVRFTSTGALDTSFGGRGIVSLPALIPSGITSVYAIAVDSENRIVGVGYHYASAGGCGCQPPNTDLTPDVVFRLLPDGRLDSSFGNGGVIRTNALSGSDHGIQLVVQPDDKLLVAGHEIVRFTESGARDGTFGSDGFVGSGVVPATRAGIAALGSTPNNSILFATDSIVIRLTASGRLDRRFGFGGEVDTGIPVDALLVEGRGGFVVAGGDETGLLRLARFLPDGPRDPHFGDGGTAATPVGLSRLRGINRAWIDLAAASEHKLVALATPNGGISATWPLWPERGDTLFALARYLPRSCIVPRITGQTLLRAKAALTRAACPLEDVRYVRTRKKLRGLVTVQRPAAGTTLPADGAVDLAVGAERTR